MLQQVILFFHLILAVALIGLVLIQHGKGADAGAAFGSGASGTVFGSQGSGNFLTRLTTGIAFLFAITSISLTILATKAPRSETLSDKLLKQESSQQQESNQSEQPTVTGDLPEAPIGSSL